MRSVYDAVKFAKVVEPKNQTGTGTPVASRITVVDTWGYNSAIFGVQSSGTTTGTAISWTVTFTVQECATSTGTFTDISGATGTVTGTALAGGYIATVRVEGLGTDRLRYLRVVPLVTMTPNDGSVLAGGVSAFAALGWAYKVPVGNSATA